MYDFFANITSSLLFKSRIKRTIYYVFRRVLCNNSVTKICFSPIFKLLTAIPDNNNGVHDTTFSSRYIKCKPR